MTPPCDLRLYTCPEIDEVRANRALAPQAPSPGAGRWRRRHPTLHTQEMCVSESRCRTLLACSCGAVRTWCEHQPTLSRAPRLPVQRRSTSCWPPSMSNVAPGDGGVRHQVDGEGGDVLGADDSPYGQGCAELLAPGVESVSEDRRGERRVDESRCDHVDADRGELEGKALASAGIAAVTAEISGPADGRRPPVPPISSRLPVGCSASFARRRSERTARSARRPDGSCRCRARRTARTEGPAPDTSTWSTGPRQVGEEARERSVSLRSNAEMLAPSSRPTRCSRSGFARRQDHVSRPRRERGGPSPGRFRSCRRARGRSGP